MDGVEGLSESMDSPLVSVICLCYNHQRFVGEAIGSILGQTYPNIQTIIIDDASTDASITEIQRILEPHPGIEFLPLKENHGNCRAFNLGLAKSKGAYIIDLSADDVMYLERVTEQVRFFEQLDQSYGVIFSDAEYIGPNGHKLGGHFGNPNPKISLTKVPSGDIYKELLGMYFLPTPTMMIRREVLEDLNGYDDSLAYEDFDFWVRSSRKYKYQYQDQVLSRIRRVPGSMSHGQYRKENNQIRSTYEVCRKALRLNQNEEENEALIRRIRYEFRQSLIWGHIKEAELFYSLHKEIAPPGLILRALNLGGPVLASLGIHHILNR